MKQLSLDRICRMRLESFRALGDAQDTPHGQLVYIDNGAPILAVGHLDYVLWREPEYNRRTKVMKCPQLDDRLGVWTLLSLLPKLGCPNFDILLTDNEEHGESTAQHFISPKDYNWIFEFDRAGDDVVMYDYFDPPSYELLDAHGFEAGYGSFTDICHLEHLSVKAFNFGVGYHDQHTENCHADLSETTHNAKRFCDFAAAIESVKLPHEPIDNDLWVNECAYCLGDLLPNWRFCPHCGVIV